MLTRIPVDLIPLAVIGLGSIVLVFITILHGLGLDRIVSRYDKKAAKLREQRRHPRLAILVFAGTIFFMLLLHIVEICIWGVLLHAGGLVHDLHEAFYFSANAYTTLGMGSMALPHNWHELAPLMAIGGLFTFAWTTSEMFNIVGEQRSLVADLCSIRDKQTAASSRS